MVRDADGAGSVGILPTAETLYWIPCPVFAEDVDLDALGDVIVPLSKEGVRRPTMPHAFHIASSFSGGIYCPACIARKRGRALPLPGCAPDDALGRERGTPSSASLASEGALSFAPDDGDRVASRSHGSDGQATRDGAPFSAVEAEHVAQPEATPVEGAALSRVPEVSPPAAHPDIDPELAAIAARIEQRYFERPDPKHEVASFERTPPHPPAPAAPGPAPRPKRPAWWNEPPQPNRAIQERADWWDERAAIMGEDKSITRAQADELAYEDMKRAYARGEIW